MESVKLVIVESPYAGRGISEQNIERNVLYARACMRDCLMRGEAPLASHLLYTQEGILDDKIPDERFLGISAGLEWGRFAEATVVYIDLGISEGMEYGINRAKEAGREIEYRNLYLVNE